MKFKDLAISLKNSTVPAALRNLERGREKEPFIRYIKEKADPKISLAQVRQELSSIKGNLSETISKQREEGDEAFLDEKCEAF